MLLANVQSPFSNRTLQLNYAKCACPLKLGNEGTKIHTERTATKPQKRVQILFDSPLASPTFFLTFVIKSVKFMHIKMCIYYFIGYKLLKSRDQ